MKEFNIPVLKTTTTPANPPAGFLALYFKSDGNLYSLNSSWVETNLSAGGGGWAVWGGITGTLSDQLDLQSALNAKQPLLVSWTNIKTINGATLLGAGNIVISGSANTAWIEDFVWDWVTTIFTLANLPASDAFVWVSGNGVFSQDGVALDYTVSGLNVTFNTAPTLGYKIQIHYIQSLWTPLSFLSQVPTGAVDGVNDTFAITNAVNTNSESIYINGLLQYPTTHYTLTGTSLVFVTPPSIGDNLFAKWVY